MVMSVDLALVRTTKQTLRSWIAEVMNDPEKDGKISQLSCVHVVGEATDEVHTVRFGNGKQWTADELADLFRHKSEGAASELPGVQYFKMFAFYAGRNEPEAKHTFMVNGQLDYGGIITEGPDERGGRMQSMRMVEMAFQLSMKQSIMLINAQAQQNKELMDYNIRLNRENSDAFGVVKELMMKQATIESDRKMEELKFQRSTAERQKWLALLPGLANRISGKELFPNKQADDSLLESLVDSLSSEDLQKLSTIVKPELLGPLMARFEEILKNRRVGKASNNEATKDINPEDDIVGG